MQIIILGRGRSSGSSAYLRKVKVRMVSRESESETMQITILVSEKVKVVKYTSQGFYEKVKVYKCR